MENAKHTSTPWHAHKPDESNGWWYVDGEDSAIGDVCTLYHDNAESNAAFIVKAVNCHEELLEALRDTVYHIKTPLSERNENWHKTGARILKSSEAAILKASSPVSEGRA